MLGRLGLRLDGRGETLGALVRDLELSLALAAARLSFGNVADGKPIAVKLDTLELAVGRDQPLRGRARGSLLGERATLSIRGGTVPSMLRERSTPVELTTGSGRGKRCASAACSALPRRGATPR